MSGDPGPKDLKRKRTSSSKKSSTSASASESTNETPIRPRSSRRGAMHDTDVIIIEELDSDGATLDARSSRTVRRIDPDFEREESVTSGQVASLASGDRHLSNSLETFLHGDEGQRKWVWSHSANENAPLQGHSIATIESHRINGSITVNGQDLPGVGYLVFVPQRSVFPHTLKVVGIHYEGLVAYPVCLVHVKDFPAQIIKENHILRQTFIDPFSGFEHKPIPYVPRGSDYRIKPNSFREPQDNRSSPTVEMFRENKYLRAAFSPEGTGQIAINPRDPLYREAMDNTERTVPLKMEHVRFNHGGTYSNQYVRLRYPQDPDNPRSNYLPFDENKEYLLPVRIPHEKIFLRYEYNDSLKSDVKVSGWRLDQHHMFNEAAFHVPMTDNLYVTGADGALRQERATPRAYEVTENGWIWNSYRRRGPTEHETHIVEL